MSDRLDYTEPLQEEDPWLAQVRRFWSALIDALEHYLDRVDPSTQRETEIRKTKTKRRTR